MTRHFNPAGLQFSMHNQRSVAGPALGAQRKAELALAMSPDDEDPGVGRDPDDYLLSEPQDDLDAGATFDPDEDGDDV